MKILYLMHIPWGWIKQRPHFLAEKLAQDNDIDVYYHGSIRHNENNSLNHEKQSFKVKAFFCPGIFRQSMRNNRFLEKLYNVLVKWQIKKISGYDCVWITSSYLYRFVESSISPNQYLIFDCMDDEIEFPSVKSDKELTLKILGYEQRLANRADYIFCSAHYLSYKLMKRTGCEKEKITILNNAVELLNERNINEQVDLSDDLKNKIELLKKNPKNLVYIGTISDWFDFELITGALANFADFKLFLIGPAEVRIPDHPQIVFLNKVERKYIFHFMKYAGALIMPFKITELVRSVNPVKLYEYLATFKPVIAPYYEETAQFEQYIYIYNNKSDFENIISTLDSGNLCPKCRDKQAVKIFVASNTWDKRYEIIKGLLKW